MKKLNFELLTSQYPKGGNDFLKFYQSNFQTVDFLKNVAFESIPFEMQLGVFLSYFTENGVELDVCNTDNNLLPDLIMDTFKDYENVISHYS